MSRNYYAHTGREILPEDMAKLVEKEYGLFQESLNALSISLKSFGESLYLAEREAENIEALRDELGTYTDSNTEGLVSIYLSLVAAMKLKHSVDIVLYYDGEGFADLEEDRAIWVARNADIINPEIGEEAQKALSHFNVVQYN